MTIATDEHERTMAFAEIAFGQIRALRPPPYFILIDRALRDEGASCHYLPASDYAEADPAAPLAISA